MNEENNTTARIEAAILGREPLREDWIRDIGLRLAMIFTYPSERELNSLLAERFKYRAAYAKPAIDAVCGLVDNRPEGYLNEIRKTRQIVSKSGAIDLSDGSAASEAILGHIDSEVAEILAQRKSIYDEWGEIRDLYGDSADSISTILKNLKALPKQIGSDRGMMIRDMKKLISQFLGVTIDVPPVLHLCNGWLTLQTPDGVEEAMSAFRTGATTFKPTVSSHLCCRILSDLYEKEGQLQRALDWSKKALEHGRTSEACIDCTLIIAEMHDPTMAKPLLEEGFFLQPLSLFALLSDERCLDLGTECLDVIVRVQTRLRREGRQSVGIWLNAIRDVQEAQRLSGAELHLSHELMEGHGIVSERLAEADMITAGFLRNYCEECAEEVKVLAREALNKEFEVKREALADARKMIDSVGIARDQQLAAAKKVQERAIGSARQQLIDASNQTQGMEKQSIYWFGSGCGLFGLYIVTKFLLASSSATAGLASPIGLVVMLISAIPIAMAIVLQVVYGVRRAALEILVREKISEANRRLSQAELEADDYHREQLSQGRKALGDAENKLKRLEVGFRHLKLNVAEEEIASTRLRVA